MTGPRTVEEWKARAIGLESELQRERAARRAAEAEAERLTQALFDTRLHIQAAALGYEWNRIGERGPIRADHCEKIKSCRELFDFIEALEDTRMRAAVEAEQAPEAAPERPRGEISAEG